MREYESPAFFERLKHARDLDMQRVDDVLPDATRIDVFTEANVCVYAVEWRDLVLLGQCINISGDGPDLDDDNNPRWSWAVGQYKPSKGRRRLGTFRDDIASALQELRQRLRTGSRSITRGADS